MGDTFVGAALVAAALLIIAAAAADCFRTERARNHG